MDTPSGTRTPRHIGIVAVSAEGAALCYRTICQEAPPLLGRHAHPQITMHTFPLSDYMRHIEADRWDEVGALLLESVDKLSTAGADFVICPDNTVHQAIDLVRDRSRLPWLHIAEEVADAAQAQGFRHLLVLGTKYLMEGPVYRSQLDRRGIRFEVPDRDRRTQIDAFIFEELVNGKCKGSTRQSFREIIAEGASVGAEAVVLGCTEIPLIVTQSDSVVPILDSTRILARAALRTALESQSSIPDPSIARRPSVTRQSPIDRP
jgi:aspartate racemase